MNEKKHSPTPWVIGSARGLVTITAADEHEVSARLAETANDAQAARNKANGEHIVRCVNAHDDLVAALREAAEAIADCDRAGHWVETADRISAALKKAGALSLG